MAGNRRPLNSCMATAIAPAMGRKRQAEERSETEIAATRVPQGSPGDPSQGPGEPRTGALEQARPGLLGPEVNRPPGRPCGARVPVAPRAMPPAARARETARAETTAVAAIGAGQPGSLTLLLQKACLSGLALPCQLAGQAIWMDS